MASIRKTKKRLKRARRTLHNIMHEQALKMQSEWLINVTEFELENLKVKGKVCTSKRRLERKIRKAGKWKEYRAFEESLLLKKEVRVQSVWMNTQSLIKKYENLADHIYTPSDFLKNFYPTMHDVMAHRESIPFKELGVKSVTKHREEINRKNK